MVPPCPQRPAGPVPLPLSPCWLASPEEHEQGWTQDPPHPQVSEKRKPRGAHQSCPSLGPSVMSDNLVLMRSNKG